MYRIRLNACASTMATGMLLCSFVASAMDIKPSASVGVKYTNNAKLASNDEVDDLIVITRVGTKIDAGSGPFQLNADASLQHKNYTQNSYGNQQYLNLNATAGWEMLKNRLDWKIQDFFSQQSINSLNPDTPDNTQDTNVFTFGPNIHFPISARQSFTLVPEYRKFTYESQNIDNQQNSLNANWNYQLFRTMNVGLSGGVNETDYDDQAVTDNKFSNIHLTLSGTRPRSNYNFNLGTTHVDREGASSERGMTGNMSWNLNITGYSSVRAYISSDLTDSNNNLLNASRNPEDGDFSNEQISSEVMRSSVARIAYSRDDASLSSSVWGKLLKQDYEFALLDRDVQSIGVDFRYPVTAVLKAGLYTHYDRTELLDVDRSDDQYSIGGNMNYQLSRKLRTTLDIKYRDKDSTLDSEDFSEWSVFINLAYSYDSASR